MNVNKTDFETLLQKFSGNRRRAMIASAILRISSEQVADKIIPAIARGQWDYYVNKIGEGWETERVVQCILLERELCLGSREQK